MEKLLVYAYLWRLSLNDGQEYNDHLDMLFLKDPDNYLLLELELLTDAGSALMRLKRYFSKRIIEPHKGKRHGNFIGKRLLRCEA